MKQRVNSDSSEKLILGFRDKNLDVTLILSPDMNKKGVFKGINVEGNLPKVYQGSEFAYFADDYYLNRMDIALLINYSLCLNIVKMVRLA